MDPSRQPAAPPIVLIAIGANLPGADGGTRLDTCRAAVVALSRLPGLRLAGLSRWYETAAIPPGGPPYVNAVALLHGAVDPAELLSWLQAIEAAAGRIRSTPNAPRPLDLDIIDLAGQRRAAPDPVLPHPRAHLRAFVLRPLADVLPGWRHPGLGSGLTELLAALPPQVIRVL